MSAKTIPCAWCDNEAGVKAPSGSSHGICPKHADEWLAEIQTIFPGGESGCNPQTASVPIPTQEPAAGDLTSGGAA